MVLHMRIPSSTIRFATAPISPKSAVLAVAAAAALSKGAPGNCNAPHPARLKGRPSAAS